MLMLSTTGTDWGTTDWDTVPMLPTLLATIPMLTHSDTITSTTTFPTLPPWLPQSPPPWSRLPQLPLLPPPW